MSDQRPRDVFRQFLTFLERLDAAAVAYHLTSVRPGAIMVQLALPGERWEVEFMQDGTVEGERFLSSGTIEDGAVLDRLWPRVAHDGE